MVVSPGQDRDNDNDTGALHSATQGRILVQREKRTTTHHIHPGGVVIAASLRPPRSRRSALAQRQQYERGGDAPGEIQLHRPAPTEGVWAVRGGASSRSGR